MKGSLGWAAVAWRSSGRGISLKNPLDSLTGTIVCGFILTVALYYVVKWLETVGVS
jgi:predicted PurR-regulated permease PerM